MTARNICELLSKIHKKEFTYIGLDLFEKNDENKSEVIMRQRGETDYKEYARAKDNKNVSFYSPTPFSFKTRLTDARKGFVDRAFVRIAANEESVPIEIKPSTFKGVPPTYKKIKIKWKITGKEDDIKTHNVNVLEKAERDFKNLTVLTLGLLDGYQPSEKEKEMIEKTNNVVKNLKNF